MKNTIHKTSKIVLIVVIALTIAFIWGNSLLDRAQSSNSSSNALKLLKPLFDPIFHLLGYSEGVSEYFIRKLAHFSEFFLLGGEISLLIILCKGINFHFIGHTLAIGLAVAVTDESLQLLSGRGSAVADVLLDFSGFALSVIVMNTIYKLILLRKSCSRAAAKLEQ